VGTARGLKRSPKPRKPVCNCPAVSELYGKAFPHKAGGVRGCHMGKEGGAKDGIARPGCHCRACDVTNTERAFQGFGTQDDRCEAFSLSNLNRDFRHWERDLLDWENDRASAAQPAA